MNIEEEYNKLCKKHKLPKFKELDREFEISALENEKFLLKNILRKISEKLEYYAIAINNILQPDTSSLSSMHEVRFFTDEDKGKMYELFKNIVKADRNIMILILENDENKEAKFLNSFLIKWLDIKKELVKYIEKMRVSWDKETSIDEDIAYFG